jgi:hypothetical protein
VFYLNADILYPPLPKGKVFVFLLEGVFFTSCNKLLFIIHVDATWLFVDHEWESQRPVILSVFNAPRFLGLRGDFLSLGPVMYCRNFLTVTYLFIYVRQTQLLCYNYLKTRVSISYDYMFRSFFDHPQVYQSYNLYILAVQRSILTNGIPPVLTIH